MLKSKKVRWLMSFGLALCLIVPLMLSACSTSGITEEEAADLEEEIATLEAKLSAKNVELAAAVKAAGGDVADLVASHDAELAAAISAKEAEITALEKQVKDAIAGGGEEIEPIHWRYSNHGTAATSLYQEQAWFWDLVDEMSDGKFTGEVFPDGTLIESKDSLAAIGAGVIEAAGTIANFHEGSLGSIVQIEYGMPGQWDEFWEPRGFFEDFGYKEEIMDPLWTAQNVWNLGPKSNYGYTLYSTKPVTKISDYDGMMIRAHGMPAEVYARLGASVVILPGGELYLSLSTGIIDAAVWGSPQSVFSWGFHEVCPYVLQPYGIDIYHTMSFVNLDAYNSLPSEYQGMLRVAYQDYGAHLLAVQQIDDAEAMVIWKRDYGGDWCWLEPAEIVKWKAVCAEQWGIMVAKTPSVKPAMDMLLDYLEILGRPVDTSTWPAAAGY